MEAQDHAKASPRPLSWLVAQLEELDNFFSQFDGPESIEGQDALLSETLMPSKLGGNSPGNSNDGVLSNSSIIDMYANNYNMPASPGEEVGGENYTLLPLSYGTGAWILRGAASHAVPEIPVIRRAETPGSVEDVDENAMPTLDPIPSLQRLNDGLRPARELRELPKMSNAADPAKGQGGDHYEASTGLLQYGRFPLQRLSSTSSRPSCPPSSSDYFAALRRIVQHNTNAEGAVAAAGVQDMFVDAVTINLWIRERLQEKWQTKYIPALEHQIAVLLPYENAQTRPAAPQTHTAATKSTKATACSCANAAHHPHIRPASAVHATSHDKTASRKHDETDAAAAKDSLVRGLTKVDLKICLREQLDDVARSLMARFPRPLLDLDKRYALYVAQCRLLLLYGYGNDDDGNSTGTGNRSSVSGGSDDGGGGGGGAKITSRIDRIIAFWQRQDRCAHAAAAELPLFDTKLHAMLALLDAAAHDCVALEKRVNQLSTTDVPRHDDNCEDNGDDNATDASPVAMVTPNSSSSSVYCSAAASGTSTTAAVVATAATATAAATTATAAAAVEGNSEADEEGEGRAAAASTNETAAEAMEARVAEALSVRALVSSEQLAQPEALMYMAGAAQSLEAIRQRAHAVLAGVERVEQELHTLADCVARLQAVGHVIVE